jgi:hypothetical protein
MPSRAKTTRSSRAVDKEPTAKKASGAKKAAASKGKAAASKGKAAAGGKAAAAGPTLLSGDNPQIAKGDGEAPVRAYLAAIPGWKADAARRLDALIVRTVPGVRKAVRWNSPFYGIEGQGWFLSFHCFAKYLKVTFLRGTRLSPLPPVESRDPNTRYFHVHEDTDLEDEQLARWIRQASEIPGDPLF